MRNELNKYKQDLNETYDEKLDDINYKNNDILGDLELYKESLESKIRIQKNKNDLKKNNIKKTQIETKKKMMDEMKYINNNKKSSIDSGYKIKISKLELEYEDIFNNYINEKISNQRQLNYSNKSYAFSMDEKLNEYKNELNELYELKKKNLEKEFKQKMEKELEEFKFEKMDEIERDKIKIENSKLDSQKDFIINNKIKRVSIDMQKTHMDDLFKLMDENIRSFPEVINNKCTQDADYKILGIKKIFQKSLTKL
jgi:hypothetical protein